MLDSNLKDFESGPFGIADGTRAAIDDDSFVEIDPLIAQLGLASQPDDRSARVIVGRKGSGKTVYLRRFQAHAGTEDSVYANALDPETPTTSQIVEFSHWNRSYDLTEQWSGAWRTAILRALCSHAVYSRQLVGYGTGEINERLTELASELLPGISTPRSPYNQLGELIHGHENGQHLEETLRQPRWGDLEYWLAEFLKEAPPIFFYLDALDEEYRAAPNYWMRCQKGLFYQVMRLLRDPSFGNRLHVVISIRDSVSPLSCAASTRRATEPTPYPGPCLGPAGDRLLPDPEAGRVDPQYVKRMHAESRTVIRMARAHDRHQRGPRSGGARGGLPRPAHATVAA